MRLKNIKTGADLDFTADGVFIAIGHSPASELFKGQLEMKSGGYLHDQAGPTATNIAGVYAAGDVTDDIYRQAVTAAGMGCMAALEAERYLAALEATPGSRRIEFINNWLALRPISCCVEPSAHKR